jgi:hypothetical protein
MRCIRFAELPSLRRAGHDPPFMRIGAGKLITRLARKATPIHPV